MIDLTPDQRIGAQRRVEAFLHDDVIVDALDQLDQKYVGEMKRAATAQDLWRAQARANAIDEFLTALRAIFQSGELAALEIKQAEKRQKEI